MIVRSYQEAPKPIKITQAMKDDMDKWDGSDVMTPAGAGWVTDVEPTNLAGVYQLTVVLEKPKKHQDSTQTFMSYDCNIIKDADEEDFDEEF